MPATEYKHDFIIITDLGGDKHAIDRNAITTITNAIPENPPKGFAMGLDIITIIVANPAGLSGYYTKESMVDYLSRVYRINPQDQSEYED